MSMNERELLVDLKFKIYELIFSKLSTLNPNDLKVYFDVLSDLNSSISSIEIVKQRQEMFRNRD